MFFSENLKLMITFYSAKVVVPKGDNYWDFATYISSRLQEMACFCVVLIFVRLDDIFDIIKKKKQIVFQLCRGRSPTTSSSHLFRKGTYFETIILVN